MICGLTGYDSKVWVRITGVGEGMKTIEDEVNVVEQNDFPLNFVYSADAQFKHLNIVNQL